MMTIILTFLKNPKNLLIVALVLIVLTFGTIVLYQRGSLAIKTGKLAEQTAEIERYKVSQKAYADLIDQYANQVVKWQKLAESQQAITNQTAKETVKIKYIKSDCKMEKDDAKIINGVVDYFNTGRMRDN
jgi:hypothetical protein